MYPTHVCTYMYVCVCAFLGGVAALERKVRDWEVDIKLPILFHRSIASFPPFLFTFFPFRYIPAQLMKISKCGDMMEFTKRKAQREKRCC